jgi:hypothetical protein
MAAIPLDCHPDRSEAKWRVLLCAYPTNEGPASELAAELHACYVRALHFVAPLQ